MTVLRSLCVLALLVTSSCVTQRATSFELPRERATECVDLCTKIDMKMAAVVVVMNHAGCVCEPKDAPPATTAHRTNVHASAVAMGASISTANASAQRVSKR